MTLDPKPRDEVPFLLKPHSQISDKRSKTFLFKLEMCGRARLAALAVDAVNRYCLANPTQAVKQQADPVNETIENLSPGSECPVLHCVDGKLICTMMIWGLIPTYLHNVGSSDHYRMFNKRIESLLPAAPYFKSLVEHKRCAVIFDGFYEWKLIAGKKHPYYTYLKGEPMCMPGIFEESTLYDNETKLPKHVKTFSIITSEPCEKFSEIHNRQPVFLTEKEMHQWLDPNLDVPRMLQSLQRHPQQSDFPPNSMIEFYPVTTRMTNPRYQEKDCSLPTTLGQPLTSFFHKQSKSIAKEQQSSSSSLVLEKQQSPSMLRKHVGQECSKMLTEIGGNSKTLTTNTSDVTEKDITMINSSNNSSNSSSSKPHNNSITNLLKSNEEEDILNRKREATVNTTTGIKRVKKETKHNDDNNNSNNNKKSEVTTGTMRIKKEDMHNITAISNNTSINNNAATNNNIAIKVTDLTDITTTKTKVTISTAGNPVVVTQKPEKILQNNKTQNRSSTNKTSIKNYFSAST